MKESIDVFTMSIKVKSICLIRCEKLRVPNVELYAHKHFLSWEKKKKREAHSIIIKYRSTTY